MSIGLLLTAFGLGLRHGFDWDHIAAITDLNSSAPHRRRGLALSLLYALGHAAVVLALGAIVVLTGSTIPGRFDDWMGRVVGATLVLLGVTVLVGLVRRGQDFRLRSRWMLIVDGTFAGLRRVRGSWDDRKITVEHEHPHEHAAGPHKAISSHDHAHVGGRIPVPAIAAAGGRDPSPTIAGEGHSHRHRHGLALPSTARGRYGAGTATGIGILHGVGVESPTQIAVFVASTSVAGRGAGLGLLATWVVGLVAANAVLAALAGFGMLHAERSVVVYQVLAVLVATGSILMGVTYLGGLDVLPSLTG